MSGQVLRREPLSAAEYQQLVADQMREDVLQARVVEAARRLGWLSYHTHDSRRSNPGFPDLVLVHQRAGRVLFRELKSSKGRLSTDQKVWLAALAAAGADVAVWRPADLFSGLIDETLRPNGGSYEQMQEVQ